MGYGLNDRRIQWQEPSKSTAGKKAWSAVGFVIIMSLILTLLFLMAIGCLAAWNAVIG